MRLHFSAIKMGIHSERFFGGALVFIPRYPDLREDENGERQQLDFYHIIKNKARPVAGLEMCWFCDSQDGIIDS